MREVYWSPTAIARFNQAIPSVEECDEVLLWCYIIQDDPTVCGSPVLFNIFDVVEAQRTVHCGRFHLVFTADVDADIEITDCYSDM
jgi:hypothetical protein